MAAVLRSCGAWSLGGTHLKAGRGAKSARRFGGSLSVMLIMSSKCLSQKKDKELMNCNVAG